jgi:hypothetical protein
MIKKFFLASIVSILLIGCTARVSVDNLTDKKYEKTKVVKVFRLSDTLPENISPIAEIYVGDLLGTTVQCEYELQLKRLKDKAKNLGADYIQITEELKPDFISYCYGIRATAYKK